MQYFLLICAVVGLEGVLHAVQPNILLIVSDDLGFSDLGCFGGEIDTPQLDALAQDGVRLTQFYNTGRCCPSRAAILTGYYPHAIGLGHMTQDIGQPGYRGRVAPHARTIGQRLQKLGYRTFLSGKWHLGTADPTRHGFEEFYGTLVSAKTFWDVDHFTRLPKNRPRREYEVEGFHGTDALGDHALDFLSLARQTPQRPWFLYLAFNAPHFPLHAHPKDIQKYANDYHIGWDKLRTARLARMKEMGIVPVDTKLPPRSPWWNYGETRTDVNPAWNSLPPDRRADLARRMAIYAAMIDQMDRNIGRVVADLKRNKELENTLILFTSDNGACAEWDPNGFDIKSSNQNILYRGARLNDMGQHGTFHSVGSGWANAANTPWRLYKHFNHEGGIASPGILHWPAGLKQKGIISHTPMHIIDILPTFLQVAGEKSIPKRPLPGVSILSQLNVSPVPPRTLFFEHEGHRAVREGRWKLVATAGQPWELYNLHRDRTELNNLASRQPQRVRAMAAAWDKWAGANYVTPFPRDYNVGYLKKRE